MHVHRLIDDNGVTEITRTDEDVDRRLRRQRLVDTGPVAVAYAGYFPYSRETVPIEPCEIGYGGYCFEDASDCPACQGSR